MGRAPKEGAKSGGLPGGAAQAGPAAQIFEGGEMAVATGIRPRMATNFEALTEKEKQTLRLIVRGHDAKSTARELGLSVHTVNERLRDARRKLEVSSSREAARIVLAAEG